MYLKDEFLETKLYTSFSYFVQVSNSLSIFTLFVHVMFNTPFLLELILKTDLHSFF